MCSTVKLKDNISVLTPSRVLPLPGNHHQPGPPQEASAGCTPYDSWRSSTHQSQQWYTSTLTLWSLSSPPSSPSGTWLQLPRTRADSSVLSAELKRWLDATCRPSKTFTPPGHWGKQERQWLTPPTSDINLLKCSVKTKASSYEDSFFPSATWLVTSTETLFPPMPWTLHFLLMRHPTIISYLHICDFFLSNAACYTHLI